MKERNPEWERSKMFSNSLSDEEPDQEFMDMRRLEEIFEREQKLEEFENYLKSDEVKNTLRSNKKSMKLKKLIREIEQYTKYRQSFSMTRRLIKIRALHGDIEEFLSKLS